MILIFFMGLKKKGSLALFLSVMAGFLTFVNSILVARLLSLEDYGVFSLAVTIIYFFIKFSDMGLNDIIFKKLPVLKKKKSFIKSVVLLNSFFGIIFGTVLLVLAKPISIIYDSPRLFNILLLGGFLVFIGTVLTLLKRILISLKRLDLNTFIKFIEAIIRLVFNIILFYLIGLNSFLAVFAIVISQLIMVLIIVFFSLKYFRKFSFRNKSFYKKIIIAALPFSIIPIVTYIAGVVNSFLIGFFVGVADVGIYAVANFPFKVFSFITPIFGNLLMPYFVQKKKGDYLFKKGLLFFYLLSIPISFIFVFKSSSLISLFYGDKYLGADVLFKIIGASVFQLGVSNILFSYYFANKTPKKIMKYNIVITILQVLLSLILIYFLGSIGAVLTDLFIKTLSIIILFSIIKKPLHFLRLFKIIILCAIPAFLLTISFVDISLLNLFIGVGLYSSAVLMFYYFSKEFNVLEFIKGVLP